MAPGRKDIVKMDDKDTKTSDFKSVGPQTTYFVETTTMHGVKQVSGAPGILKYIWLPVFLALTGLLIWHSHKQIAKYLKYETKTSVSIKTESSTKFPAVTVCNLNSAKRSAVKNDSFWGVLLEMDAINHTDMDRILNAFNNSSNPSNSTTVDSHASENQEKNPLDDGQSCSDKDGDGEIDGSDCDEKPFNYLEILTRLNQEGIKDPSKIFEYLLKESHVNDLSDIISLISLPPEVIEKAGYTQEEFIVDCTFDRNPCPSDAFTKSYDRNYGNCFTFNLGMTTNPLVTSMWGSSYGLRLSLNIKAEEYIGLMSSDYGARVSVQRPRTLADPLSYGFNAAPGQQTAVGLSKERISRLKQPYKSQCMDKFPAEYAPMVVLNGIYTYEGCMQACQNSVLIERCGCMDQSSTIVNKIRNHCNLFDLELLPCFINASYELAFLECDCALPCTEIGFDRTISTSAWPTVQYKNLQVKHNPQAPISTIMLRDVLAKDLNDENGGGNGPYAKKNVESNIVRLHVYFEVIDLNVVEESPDYPNNQLIADLGGVISLYLGVSVVTLLEVMQYIFLVAFKIKPT